MRRAVLIHSPSDIKFAEKICKDISLSTVNVILERAELDSLSGLDKAREIIIRSNLIVPLISADSSQYSWARDDLPRYLNSGRFKCLLVTRENQASERSEVLNKLPIFRRAQKVAFTEDNYETALSDLVDRIAPEIDVEEAYASIEARTPDNHNPFRRVRTEHYESLETIAALFAEPEGERYGRLVEIKPTIIQGGRGCGKSMLLKSMQPIVAVSRSKSNSFKDAKIDYFGVYSRLIRGPFSSKEEHILRQIDVSAATKLSSTVMVLQLTQTIIEEIRKCCSLNILNMNRVEEAKISQNVSVFLSAEGIKCESLNEVDDQIQTYLRTINEYVGKKIIGGTPEYEGIFLDTEQLKDICRAIITSISDLSKATIYFLLDEYENLLGFQKTVVNTLLKWSEKGIYTVKIASKKTGFQDGGTLEEQDIEEPDDYTLIDCDYDLGDARSRALYLKQLKKICSKILKLEGIGTSIEELLEKGPPAPNLSDEDITREIISMAEGLKKSPWSTISLAEQNEYLIKFKTAAIYRLLKSRRRQFSGMKDLALLSSGIIRRFLELCGMSYYFALREGIDIRKGEKIAPRFQTEAAFALSSYYLANIRKNISVYGFAIQQLVIAIGDILHYKLLYHPSNPEASLISVTDPQSLFPPSTNKVKNAVDAAILHSVIQTPTYGLGGNRPSGYRATQPTDLILNRIYAPCLRFSPRTRWSTNIEIRDLEGLLDESQRGEVKSNLIKNIHDLRKTEPIQVDEAQTRLINIGVPISDDTYKTVED